MPRPTIHILDPDGNGDPLLSGTTSVSVTGYVTPPNSQVKIFIARTTGGSTSFQLVSVLATGNDWNFAIAGIVDGERITFTATVEFGGAAASDSMLIRIADGSIITESAGGKKPKTAR